MLSAQDHFFNRAGPESYDGREPGQPEAHLILAVLDTARTDYLYGSKENRRESIAFFESELLDEYCNALGIDPETYLEAVRKPNKGKAQQTRTRSGQSRKKPELNVEKVKRLAREEKLSQEVLSLRFRVPKKIIQAVLNDEISNREFKKHINSR